VGWCFDPDVLCSAYIFALLVYKLTATRLFLGQPGRLYDPSRDLLATPFTQATLVKVSPRRRVKKSTPPIISLKTAISTDNFVELLGHDLSMGADAGFLDIWVPEAILKASLPIGVLERLLQPAKKTVSRFRLFLS
jgi:hypothetical protein